MFDYSFTHWVTFLTAALLLNLSPGPDMAFILGQTIRKGMPAGFCAMFGIWLGATMHVVCATVGLSMILVSSAMAFSIVKWVGALYLIWLGIQSLLTKDEGTSASPARPHHTMSRIFKQGFLVAVLNPKVAIFFLAFLPQFVVTQAGSVHAQLFLHGALVIVVAAFVEPPLVIIGGKLGHRLTHNRRIYSWINRGLGGIFIGLGIKLALTKR